jgi:hypothetical protein
MQEKESLPDWFKGKIFKEGEIVTNPLTGDGCRLNAIELSIYHSIVNIENKRKNENISVSEGNRLMRGFFWFLENNFEAYRILLFKDEDY